MTGTPCRTLIGAVIAAMALLGTFTVNRVLADASPAPAASGAAPSAPVLRVQVLQEIPHDRAAFTQGFEVGDGVLYEGTGLSGQSQLRKVDPGTGAVLRSARLPGRLFGEGITVVGNRIWQLTYRDGVVLEWNRETLTVTRRLPLDGEGWGLCHDGSRLVRSDGTDRLRFHDPNTFAPTGSVAVTRDGAPVTQLNELECVDGQVYANVWRTDEIHRIDPATGAVTAVIDAAGLIDEPSSDPNDVLNGIAALGNGEFLITGKRWPTAFRVRFTPAG